MLAGIQSRAGDDELFEADSKLGYLIIIDMECLRFLLKILLIIKQVNDGITVDLVFFSNSLQLLSKASNVIQIIW